MSVVRCIYTKTSFLNNFLKSDLRHWERNMQNRSLFIYGDFIFLTRDMRTGGLLIWKSMKNFNLPMLNATETIKIWSKRKLSEISELSILGVGQNLEMGIFLLKPYHKVKVFSFRSFFQLQISSFMYYQKLN